MYSSSSPIKESHRGNQDILWSFSVGHLLLSVLADLVWHLMQANYSTSQGTTSQLKTTQTFHFGNTLSETLQLIHMETDMASSTLCNIQTNCFARIKYACKGFYFHCPFALTLTLNNFSILCATNFIHLQSRKCLNIAELAKHTAFPLNAEPSYIQFLHHSLCSQLHFDISELRMTFGWVFIPQKCKVKVNVGSKQCCPTSPFSQNAEYLLLPSS